MARNGGDLDFGHWRNVTGYCATHLDIVQHCKIASWRSAMLHRLSAVLLLGKGLLYTKGGADQTFASAKVKNAIGRIGIFLIKLQQRYSDLGFNID